MISAARFPSRIAAQRVEHWDSDTGRIAPVAREAERDGRRPCPADARATSSRRSSSSAPPIARCSRHGAPRRGILLRRPTESCAASLTRPGRVSRSGSRTARGAQPGRGLPAPVVRDRAVAIKRERGQAVSPQAAADPAARPPRVLARTAGTQALRRQPRPTRPMFERPAGNCRRRPRAVPSTSARSSSWPASRSTAARPAPPGRRRSAWTSPRW